MKIKIKALSLALLSIAWMSHAQAQTNWSGASGCNGSNGETCTIRGSAGPISGSGTLVINPGAIVSGSSGNNAITTSGTFTITNSGTINGATSNAVHGIKVNNSGSGYSGTITNNSGANISGAWNGISVETGSGTGTINIANSGAITGVSGQGILINASGLKATITNSGTVSGNSGSSGVGISIQNAASGTTLTNSGNVSGRVAIATGGSSSTIDSIKLTGGTVSGSYRGLELSGNVNNIEIQSGATVVAPATTGGSVNYKSWATVGIALNAAQFNTFTNNGKIQGALGLMLTGNKVKIDTFTNSGTIESTNTTDDWVAAVMLVHYYSSAEIDNFTNESSGKIIAHAGHGVALEFGTTIGTLTNKGSIEAGGNGIYVFWGGGGSGTTTINTINLDEGSSIVAGREALHLDLPDGNSVALGTLKLASGASIESQNGPGIYLGSNAQVNGSGASSGPYITLAGTITSTDSALVNNGVIGSENHSGTVIKIDPTAEFKGTQKTNIVNNGTINGDIEFENKQNATFSNLGTFNGKLIVKGTGNVTINDWAMSVVPSDDGQAKVEQVQINHSGSNTGKVIIDHVSINEISSALMGKNIDFSNAFVNENGEEIRINSSPTSVTIGSVPSSLGFDGTYDAQTNKFYTSFNIAQTAGAVVSQTLANQLMRRDFFLESAVTEAATGSLYHRLIDGVEGTAFVKPYASSDTFDLDGANMEGTTQGVMMGINRFVGRHILTGYVGYERSQIDSDFRSSTMNLDVQSWYGGFNTAHLLQAGQYVDTFLKGSLKASYTTTGIDRQILLNANTTSHENVVGSNASVIQSGAKPNTVAVGMNVQLGMNFKPMKETQIIPMMGLGYSIGKTSSYQLDRTGLINDSYMPERVMMPYADASVTWFQGWGKIVRTFVGGGMRYILDRTQKTALSYGKLPIEGEYSLPQSFQYVNASMVLHITHHSEIALGYTGVFDSTGHSQNLTTKYELHF